MPGRGKASHPRQVELLVGTRKEGFIFRSDLRRKTWRIDGPFFTSCEVNHLVRDPRNGHIFAAANNAWWGNELHVSTNGGKKWQKSSAGLGFAEDRGLKLARIWNIFPDCDSGSNVLWCGVDPGALFRSDDGGKNWAEVRSLTEHPTRGKWNPGAGGMMVHTIVPDPANPQRIFVAISAAGCFRSDDDGQTWQAFNKGVRMDFQPEKFPEVGQCVHRMTMDPVNPNVLYQQNHCGQYRSDDAGATWKDVSRGLPSRFGFPIARHPRVSGTIYVVPEIDAEHRYTPDGGFAVWRSRNGGRKWEKLTRGLPQKNTYWHVFRHATASEASPDSDEGNIYVGTSSGELLISRNSGNSWEMLPVHLPSIVSLEASVV
ncbi:MAG: exo-alpha-sialidase [Terriglobia bacterium]|jgi:photosystem II stability/assembly factor-like uncharacterized protein